MVESKEKRSTVPKGIKFKKKSHNIPKKAEQKKTLSLSLQSLLASFSKAFFIIDMPTKVGKSNIFSLRYAIIKIKKTLSLSESLLTEIYDFLLDPLPFSLVPLPPLCFLPDIPLTITSLTNFFFVYALACSSEINSSTKVLFLAID